MNYNIRCDEKNNLLRIEYSGELTIEIANNMTQNINSRINEIDCKNLLVDLRNAKLNVSMTDTIFFATSLKERGINIDVKSAVVVSENLEQYFLGEMISQNRGWNIKHFTNIAEADDWLISA